MGRNRIEDRIEDHVGTRASVRLFVKWSGSIAGATFAAGTTLVFASPSPFMASLGIGQSLLETIGLSPLGISLLTGSLAFLIRGLGPVMSGAKSFIVSWKDRHFQNVTKATLDEQLLREIYEEDVQALARPAHRAQTSQQTAIPPVPAFGA